MSAINASHADHSGGALDRLFDHYDCKIYPIGRVFEKATEELYRLLLKPGDHAIDHGSHKGRHCFPMADCVGGSGRVYAFEAINWLYGETQLAAIKRGYAQISFYNLAVSDTQKRVSFAAFRDHEAYSGIEARDDLPSDFYSGKDKIDLLAVATSQIVPKDAPVRFIKSDLEGGEFDALSGSEPILATQRPVIVFENDRAKTAEQYGYSRDTFFGFFNRLDYDLFDMAGSPFGPDRWQGPIRCWNYVAIPRAEAALAAKLPEILAKSYV